MLQDGKKRASWSRSKTGIKWSIAPSREKASELELEQNRNNGGPDSDTGRTGEISI